ncbi:MAG: hypothetical protein ACI4R8_04285 [Candidatus Caccovivens sp.]
MAQTEVTVQVFEELTSIEKKLLNLGFEKTEEFDGKDDYFTSLNNSQIKNADYSQLLNSSLIVRSYSTLKNNSPTSMLLRKVKKLDKEGNVIGEQKISTLIDNPQNAKQMLSSVGLTNWVSLKQKNSFYTKGEKQIIVGSVENLGNFIEIEEYDSISKLSEEQKFDELAKYIESFGFNIGKDYSCKKVYMLYQKLNNKKENCKTN